MRGSRAHAHRRVLTGRTRPGRIDTAGPARMSDAEFDSRATVRGAAVSPSSTSGGAPRRFARDAARWDSGGGPCCAGTTLSRSRRAGTLEIATVRSEIERRALAPTGLLDVRAALVQGDGGAPGQARGDSPRSTLREPRLVPEARPHAQLGDGATANGRPSTGCPRWSCV